MLNINKPHHVVHTERPIYELKYSKEMLEEMKEYYKNKAPAGMLPRFLHRILKLEPSSDLEKMSNNPVTYKFDKDGYYLIKENLIYNNSESGEKNFKLLGWFIHPDNLKSTIFENPENRELGESFQKILEVRKSEIGNLRTGKPNELESTPGTARGRRRSFTYITERSASQEHKKIKDETYINTILDLKPCHLEMLESLKKDMEKQLKDVYKVNENDKVEMFFHFPIQDVTTTLHLHAAVNVHERSLHEKNKEFFIDDIIAGFKNGKQIEEIILDLTKGREMLYNQFDFTKMVSDSHYTKQEFKTQPLSIQNMNYSISRPIQGKPNDTKMHYAPNQMKEFKKPEISTANIF